MSRTYSTVALGDDTAHGLVSSKPLQLHLVVPTRKSAGVEAQLNKHMDAIEQGIAPLQPGSRVLIEGQVYEVQSLLFGGEDGTIQLVRAAAIE